MQIVQGPNPPNESRRAPRPSERAARCPRPPRAATSSQSRPPAPPAALQASFFDVTRVWLPSTEGQHPEGRDFCPLQSLSLHTGTSLGTCPVLLAQAALQSATTGRAGVGRAGPPSCECAQPFSSCVLTWSSLCASVSCCPLLTRTPVTLD